MTSKYTVLKPTSSKVEKRQKYAFKRAQSTLGNTNTATDAIPSETVSAPTATFVLKTYDPVSGICLQYETNKAAEVGRLVGALGRLAKHSAAIKDVMWDLADPASRGGVNTPEVVAAEAAKGDVQMTDVGKILESKTGTPGPGAGSGGGGKKKKKGKK